MKATFLTKTARTQGQSISFFRNPFSLVPMADFAKIADMLSRNEIASANELRNAIGWKPSKNPKADELLNSNMPTPPPPPDSRMPTKQQYVSGGSPNPALTPVPRPAMHPMLQRQLTGTGGNSQNGA
jgi:hypothetical protein